MIPRVILSVAHGKTSEGKYDPGATANGYEEHKVSLKVVTETIPMINTRGGMNIQGVSTDTVLSLVDRIRKINEISRGDELAIELHMNSASDAKVSGIEVYYIAGNTIAQQAAETFGKLFAKRTGLPFRGAKPDSSSQHPRLAFVRDTRPLALLVEMGFITHISDAETINDRGATALCYTLLDYFKMDTTVHGNPDNELEPWELAEQKAGVLNGYFSGTYPRRNMTRIEAASLVRKSMRLILKSIGDGTQATLLQKLTLPNES